jgi:hypothetical protein
MTCTWALYELCSKEREKLPVRSVVLAVVGKELHLDRVCSWIEVRIEKTNGQGLTVKMLVDGDPFTIHGQESVCILRYILKEEDEPPLEYLDRSTGSPILPKFGFMDYLVPRAKADSSYEGGFFRQGVYLGLPIVLREYGNNAKATVGEPERIMIDTDLFVGTHRTFRDVSALKISNEGGEHSLPTDRIWTGEDYEYTPLGYADICQMIDAGFNYFRADDKQEEWLRRKPVFYYKADNLKYPDVLYRSNFRGVGGFIDEPAMHLSGDLMKDIEGYLKVTPQEVAKLLEHRAYEAYDKARFNLHRQLIASGFFLGDMVLTDDDQFIYDTAFSSSCYQTKATRTSIVLESRFWLRDIRLLNVLYGTDIPYAKESLIQFYYAFLRGAIKPFGQRWGMGVYGQMEHVLQVASMQLAYDMGAKYIFFWTSDRLHHVPYREQMDLARVLQKHKNKNPRDRQIEPLTSKVAIALPYGYMLQLGPMWYCPAFHLERKNQFDRTYREVLHSAVLEAERCTKQAVYYDIIIDEEPFTTSGYDHVIRVKEDGSVEGTGKRIFLGIEMENVSSISSSGGKLRVRIGAEPSTGKVPLVVNLSAEIIPRNSESLSVRSLAKTQVEVMWEIQRPDGSVVNFWDGRIAYDLGDLLNWKKMQETSGFQITSEFDKVGVYKIGAYAWDGEGNVGHDHMVISVHK